MKIPEGGQSNVIDEFQQVHTNTEINPIHPNIPAEDDFSRNLHEDEISPVVTSILTNNEELENQPPDIIVPPLSTETRKSARQQTPTQVFLDSVSQEHLIFSAFLDKRHAEDYLIQESMETPVAFKASTDPDTLYYHEAIAASDFDNFVEAIIKEVDTHCERDHWELILKENVPKNKNIIDSVWAMKRKRDIKTRKVYKWKARLNIHGGQHELGKDYFETHSLVVTPATVRLIMLLFLIKRWQSRQVDFVMAYPQTPIEFDMFMHLPHGITTKHGNSGTHVLILKKNLYGQKQAGKIWNEFLEKGLKKIGFKQSRVDECLFYKDTMLFFFYVDDGIFLAQSENAIKKTIQDLIGIVFYFEYQGYLDDYLGVNFEHLPDGNIKVTQPYLIDQIIQEVGITPRMAGKPTPAATTKILRRNEGEKRYDGKPFHYRQVVGKLNFLEKSTRPIIAYAVHQCARFSIDPDTTHAQAIIHIARYLRDTRDKGILFDPNKEMSLEVFADADFAGLWNKDIAEEDVCTSKSRTGYVITFVGCPVL